MCSHSHSCWEIPEVPFSHWRVEVRFWTVQNERFSFANGRGVLFFVKFVQNLFFFQLDQVLPKGFWGPVIMFIYVVNVLTYF